MDVEQAAAILGVKPDAVRKRLRRGTLAGRRVGDTWHVDLELPQAVPQAAEPSHEPSRRELRAEPQATEQAERSELVAELRAEVARLAAALERSQAGEAELRRLLAMQTPALPAAVPPQSAENGPVVSEPTSAPSTPWWAFWRR